MSQHFILGTDYLEQQHCVINLITGTLTVGMDSHCVPLYSSKQPSVCHVIVGETTEVDGISTDTQSGDVVHAPVSRTEKLVSSTIKHMVDQNY